MRRLLPITGLLVILGYAPAGWSAGLLTPADDPAGAGQAGRGSGSGMDKGGDCRELPPAESTKLGLIRQMLAAGKPYAAIAYLDAAGITAPQADLVRADGLRQTGREEQAAQLYRSLQRSCVAGYAYQGLGLIASKAGKAREALAQMQAASKALPVDASIRNDHGYALMAVGDDKAALHEFLTALELAPGNRRAVNNLIVLLSRGGQQDKAKQFADQFGVSAQELAGLQKIARQPLPGLAAEGGQVTGMTRSPLEETTAMDKSAQQDKSGAK